MSMRPYFYRPSRYGDFGLALRPVDILQPLQLLRTDDHNQPWRRMQNALREMGFSIKADKDKFQINVDVQHFAPEEIAVKITDGFIVIEGKHEEKQDEHGYISRQFVRRYAIPEGTNIEAAESKLSSDGVLTVVAPRKAPEAQPGEKSISIQHTGPVKKEMKESV